ncbi:hypothetical protein LEMLEM_LOCUS15220 [Lemmus lemmus]
MKNLLLSVGRL